MSDDGRSVERVKHCVDLFAGLGGFSQAFEESEGWEVTTVDREARFNPDVQCDVMELDPSGPDPDIVLASPPCVDFSVACITDKWDYDEYRRPFHLPKKAQVAESIALVFRALWLVNEWNPDYWFLENPQGMLNVWLNDPVARVDYCAYGSDFKKPTQLWGHHPPMDYRTCPGSKCGHNSFHESNVNDDHGTLRDDDSAERAKVPYQLSRAILEAVEDAYANPPPEQATLGEVSNP